MFAIPNCDTVKKARTFLEKNQVSYQFVDFKKTPPTKTQISVWTDYMGELPINKKGMTYRKYKDHYDSLSTADKVDFIIANPAVIKRPVLESEGKTIAVGFDEAGYRELLI